MNNKCNIIKDILPLYAENMVSEDTKRFVEEHLEKCTNCSEELDKIRKNENNNHFTVEKPIKDLKRKLLNKRIATVSLTILITLALGIVLFTGLITPKYFPYSNDLVNIIENENGTVTVKILEPATNYNCNVVEDPDSGNNLYFINAWTSALERLKPKISQNTTEFQINDENFLIFYTQNNGKDDVLLYGEPPFNFGNIRSLPRLYLNYYFIIAIALFIALTLLGFILEKKLGNTKLVKAINVIIPIPFSYAIAHLCSVFSGLSGYSHTIYFISNLSLTVIIYFIQMLIIRIIKIKKENKQIN